MSLVTIVAADIGHKICHPQAGYNAEPRERRDFFPTTSSGSQSCQTDYVDDALSTSAHEARISAISISLSENSVHWDFGKVARISPAELISPLLHGDTALDPLVHSTRNSTSAANSALSAHAGNNAMKRSAPLVWRHLCISHSLPTETSGFALGIAS